MSRRSQDHLDSLGLFPLPCPIAWDSCAIHTPLRSIHRDPVPRNDQVPCTQYLPPALGPTLSATSSPLYRLYRTNWPIHFNPPFRLSSTCPRRISLIMPRNSIPDARSRCRRRRSPLCSRRCGVSIISRPTCKGCATHWVGLTRRACWAGRESRKISISENWSRTSQTCWEARPLRPVWTWSSSTETWESNTSA